MLGLRCCMGFSVVGRGYFLVVACRLLMASAVAEHRLSGSVIVAHGLSCSAACGIFWDQGSNPCPLHREADSPPLSHRGSPSFFLEGSLQGGWFWNARSGVGRCLAFRSMYLLTPCPWGQLGPSGW